MSNKVLARCVIAGWVLGFSFFYFGSYTDEQTVWDQMASLFSVLGFASSLWLAVKNAK